MFKPTSRGRYEGQAFQHSTFKGKMARTELRRLAGREPYKSEGTRRGRLGQPPLPPPRGRLKGSFNERRGAIPTRQHRALQFGRSTASLLRQGYEGQAHAVATRGRHRVGR